MGEDFDRSLDDIIKLRNIRSNAGVKSGGGGGGMKSTSTMANRLTSKASQLNQMKPRAKIEDARNKLLMKQRVKLKDAREKLNQRARMTDAREKLNRLGVYKGNAAAPLQRIKVQKAAVLPRFNLRNPAAIRLTRTVNNLSQNRIRQNPKEKSTLLASVGVRQGELKKVFLTGSGLTVNTQTRPAGKTIPSSGNLFARTVNSLTQEAAFQSGLGQDVRNPVYQRKRKLVEEDDDEDPDYASAQSPQDAKRLKFPEESVVSAPRHRAAATAAASKISPGLQSRLGDADAGIPAAQGAKLLVSNLHAIVTQQDLVELFGDVGPLRKAHFVGPGAAEVVFVSRSDAQKAVENYHNRELDGQPMICKLVNPARFAGSIRAASLPGSSGIKVGTLRSDHVGSEARVKSRVAPDLGVIHKALFHKTSAQTSRASIVVTM